MDSPRPQTKQCCCNSNNTNEQNDNLCYYVMHLSRLCGNYFSNGCDFFVQIGYPTFRLLQSISFHQCLCSSLMQPIRALQRHPREELHVHLPINLIGQGISFRHMTSQLPFQSIKRIQFHAILLCSKRSTRGFS